MSRQRVNYHLNALADHGLVVLVEERPRRGLTERVMVASAKAYALSPEVLGASAANPDSVDRLSSRYLIAVAGRVVARGGDPFTWSRQGAQATRNAHDRHRRQVRNSGRPDCVRPRTRRHRRRAVCPSPQRDRARRSMASADRGGTPSARRDQREGTYIMSENPTPRPSSHRTRGRSRRNPRTGLAGDRYRPWDHVVVRPPPRRRARGWRRQRIVRARSGYASEGARRRVGPAASRRVRRRG